MLEFLENETIEVIDTQAWIESNEATLEIQLIVTNMRFLAVQEEEQGKRIICALNLDEIKKVDHQSRNTICWLDEAQFVKFDSDPIGEYLNKIIVTSEKNRTLK